VLIHRTVTTLADGRELIYFDRPGIHREVVPDLRDLPPQPHPGEARFDPRTGDWVIVATHRQDRIFLPAADSCPLCPSTPDNLTEVPAADYDVVVFGNRFPALVGTGIALSPDGTLMQAEPATGRCEVICFDSRHDLSFAGLDADQVRLVIEAWADRTAALSARPDVVQVFCFENRGKEIGVTQTHPHGQIYAYPTVVPRTAKMLARATAYRAQHGDNLFEAMVTAERADGTRVVASNEHWVAFVPFAARWPYEVHLYPRVRVPDLPSLGTAERDALAPIYLDLVQRFERLFDEPAPYIAAWHQAPKAEGANELALHLELFTNRRTSTKLKYLAGTESGMDMFSSDVVPEAAAKRLRELQ
jgi:UDPglucose--hexose-1-phosphate uridylyltransferase